MSAPAAYTAVSMEELDGRTGGQDGTSGSPLIPAQPAPSAAPAAAGQEFGSTTTSTTTTTEPDFGGSSTTTTTSEPESDGSSTSAGGTTFGTDTTTTTVATLSSGTGSLANTGAEGSPLLLAGGALLVLSVGASRIVAVLGRQD